MRTVMPLLSTLFLLAASAVPSESRTVTYLFDGAVIEFEAAAVNGVVEFPLPAQLAEESLHIKPLVGTSIKRVDILPPQGGSGKSTREPVTLLEQKNRLEDRLKALAVREEIFKAAAKAQSGKAPRRSKTNPDPMQGIRQGTEFAIAQLEAVYTARRKTEQEIQRLNSRLANAKQETADRQALTRVRVSPARGRVLVRYAVTGDGWTPLYDLYLTEGSNAQLHLSGRFSGTYPGYIQQAAPTTLAGPAAETFTALPGQGQRLAEFILKVSDVRFGGGVRTSFSFILNNQAGRYLPEGEANLYRNGEYLGRFRFEGMSSGKSRGVKRDI